MNVLIIPEDFRKDGFILNPIFRRLLDTLEKRTAKVRICHDPLLGGVGEALKEERLREVVERHRGMVDVFILCVDRDGEVGRRHRLEQIEALFGDGPTFLCENAWEEVETWLLAGLDLPNDCRWQDVRAEVDVKERYFKPLAKLRGVSDGPGGGRKLLGEEAARNIAAIRTKCREDFDRLARRLADALQDRRTA